MKYDYLTCYNKVSNVLREKPRLLACARIFNKACTFLFIAVYGAVLAFAIWKDFAPIDTLKLLGAPALCLFLATILRYVINRPRPYSEQGAGIVPLHDKTAQDKSFPSRHVSCAFVIATVILPYAVWAGVSLFLFGALLAFVRFALGLHYPSDLLVGAGLGFLCGLLSFFL